MKSEDWTKKLEKELKEYFDSHLDMRELAAIADKHFPKERRLITYTCMPVWCYYVFDHELSIHMGIRREHEK